jgi:choline dehydrogenase
MSVINEHPDPVDVLIVGGGSAGSVLAARLSEDPTRTVRLLEAGEVYPLDSVPADLLNPAHVPGEPEHDWGFTMRGSQRSPEIVAPRGKTLGGSSAVNAAVAMRAAPDDIRKWNQHGVEGWSPEEVAPAFKTMENAPHGDPAIHGRSGQFPVRQLAYSDLTSSLKAFIEAGAAAGHERVEDFNSDQRRGVGAASLNVIDGERQSAAGVYLTDEVRRRPNLTIDGGALVDRVLFENGAATGVVDATGTVHRAHEVILSAGAYASPAILLRSGVGPADDLGKLGIGVIADLPVGQRLVDHPFYYNAYALNPDYLDMSPATGALLWTASSEARGAELDLHVSATHLMDPKYSPTGGAIVLAIAVVAPDSHGTVRLRSTDPREQPEIDSNFLSEERDRKRMLEGVKLSRELGRSPQLAPLLAAEMLPGADVQDDVALTDAIDGMLASYGHPVGTAPMGGPQDPWAVVDSDGAVKGVQGLRVIDASIMPEITTVATNQTVIMIAERLAQRVYAAPSAHHEAPRARRFLFGRRRQLVDAR